MKVVLKKTTELTESEIMDFIDCFVEVYNHQRTVETFKNEYLNTCLGYSLHSLLIDDNGKIGGSWCIVPFPYEVDGKNMIFGCGIDLMIKKEYRKDLDNLMELIRDGMKYMKDNGYGIYLGFPNDNSDIVGRVVMKNKRIATLDTYILPYKVGDYKKNLAILNPCSMLFSYCMMGLARLFTNKKEITYRIKKKQPEYDTTRYNWFDKKQYVRYNEAGITAIWKIADFEGVKACFLLDVYPMSKKNFDNAVRVMHKTEKNRCGLFLYVGILPFSPFCMIKIPRKFEPKAFRFDVKILDKSLDQNLIYNVANWEVSLASYDLI